MFLTSKPTTVVPGHKICKADEQHVAGQGTYVRHGFIFSSLLGYVVLDQNEDQVCTIEVHHGTEQNVVPSAGSIVTARITNINSRACKCSILSIEGTVLREPFHGQIRCISQSLSTVCRNVRGENVDLKEDVRATEKDLVEIYKCFRPGDIVLARVLSLGDTRSYSLSTAEDELGVVIAYSEAGSHVMKIKPGKEFMYPFHPHPSLFSVKIKLATTGRAMIPVSWTEMQCPKTYLKEHRKVAKVFPEQD